MNRMKTEMRHREKGGAGGGVAAIATMKKPHLCRVVQALEVVGARVGALLGGLRRGLQH